jgi:hypothetical protein
VLLVEMTSRSSKSRVTSSMDFKGPLIQSVIVATCFSTFVAACEAAKPMSSSAASSSSSLGSLALVSTS